MATITLKPAGATANIGLHGNVTINGSSPQWADADDGTSAVGDAAGSGFKADMAAPLEALVLPDGATVTAIRAMVRASSTGTDFAEFTLAEGPALSDFSCYFTNDLADLSDNDTELDGSGVAADYDLVVATGAEIDVDALTTLLGTPYVAAHTGGLSVLTVYGFTVFVDYDAVSQIGIRIPPLRLTNRDDEFGPTLSLTRSGRSRQGGNRLTGYL